MTTPNICDSMADPYNRERAAVKTLLAIRKIAALIGGNNLRIYELDRDYELESLLIDRSRVANFSIGWIANRLATAEERIEELEDRPMFLKRQAS